jgi:regulator of sigma E protease
MTVIIFLIVLAVLIFVHELGHFLAARLFGIRVDAFALGFGPKIFAWTRGETRYALNLIPFGGYVKIFGENPDDESLRGPDSARSFINKPKWQQVIVLAAGVLFNFIFAWTLYVITFVGGVTATTAGFEQYADRFENQRVMVSFVSPGSPAEAAGLKLGDMILGVGMAKTVEEIQNVINASQGAPVQVEIARQGAEQTLSLSPAQGLVENKYAIGIAMENVGDLKLPFFTAIKEGTNYFGMMFKGTAVGLWQFFSSIFRGTANFADVAGPIGIATIVGDSAQLGMAYLLMITALISINLGIINLVPFPALDGGRIFFIAIESIIRRRIPMKFANTVNAVGFALLMLLMVVVTYKDVVKLIK